MFTRPSFSTLAAILVMRAVLLAFSLCGRLSSHQHLLPPSQSLEFNISVFYSVPSHHRLAPQYFFYFTKVLPSNGKPGNKIIQFIHAAKVVWGRLIRGFSMKAGRGQVRDREKLFLVKFLSLSNKAFFVF